MIFKKFIDNFVKGSEQDRQATLYRNLIKHEAKIGGQLFGEVPEGRRREFFCLDENTWVWHEEWQVNGQTNTMTTRYEIRSNGIYKVQHGHYKPVSDAEARKLIAAAKTYYQRVMNEVYTPAGA